jgi:hypothetical protein
MKPFDIFLSYRSTDGVEAETLRDALEARGARVWLDKDQIRPGDLFAEALENGLATSRSVGLIATPESIASNWVKNEYYRALSLSTAGELQLIALLFGPAQLPGFLKDRSWINFQDGDYRQNVDKLLWPGITGRHVLFVSVSPGHGFTWRDLADGLSQLGCKVAEGEDITRATFRIPLYVSRGSVRIVAVVDIFEGWPDSRYRRNTPSEYAEFIFGIRKATKGTTDEIVFLLYHHSEAFARAEHDLSPEQRKRLARYFTLHSNLAHKQRNDELAAIWLRIQQELLYTERMSTCDDALNRMQHLPFSRR